MALGILLVRSPYTPYSVYLKGIIGFTLGRAFVAEATCAAQNQKPQALRTPSELLDAREQPERKPLNDCCHLSYSLNCLKGGYIGDHIGEYCRGH